jgi:hypothetical protein
MPHAGTGQLLENTKENPMIHSPDGPTAPELVERIANAIALLEEIQEMPLEITRDDDYALATALTSLRQIADSNEGVGQ